MTEESNDIPTDAPDRWQLIRDLVGFQFKLALDGIRDLVLSPISIVAGIIGLITSPKNPSKYFNQVLEFGRKSDVWINLFGAAHHSDRESDEDHEGSRNADASSSDAYIKKLEERLVAEYNKGGVVKNLKDRTDNLMNQIHKGTDQDV